MLGPAMLGPAMLGPAMLGPWPVIFEQFFEQSLSELHGVTA